MLKKFTREEREDLKNKYKSEPLFIAAETVCSFFDNRLQAYVLWAEDIFNEAVVIIDNIKENGETYYPELPKLWKNIYPRFRDYDKTVPDPQIVLATSIVLAIPAIVLRLSTDKTHQNIAEHIAEVISNHNQDQWLQVFSELGNECNRFSKPLSKWINDYMKLENEQYISDEIEDMFTPLSKTKKTEVKQLDFEPNFMTFSLCYQTTTAHITFLYQAMCNRNWIDKDTKPDDFTNLFRGKICRCRIKRANVGSDNIYALFQKMVDRNFIKVPHGHSLESIVRSHFINKDEQYIAKNTSKYSVKALTDINTFCDIFTVQIDTDD